MISTLFYIILTFILSSAIWMGIATIVIKRMNKKLNNAFDIIEYMSKFPGRPIKKLIKK
tara:strand:- start:2188 stop:2364 length:177 start_codon:yes stop_codon:yes gene_type:complete